MNEERYPREPIAAIGIPVVAVVLLLGASGAAQHVWPQALIGFAAPLLMYFLLPPRMTRLNVRQSSVALMGGIVVAIETFLWAGASGSMVVASTVAAVLAGLYVALYLIYRRWRRPRETDVDNS